MSSPATVYVSDLQRALPFYTDVLGFCVVSREPAQIRVQMADGELLAVRTRDRASGDVPASGQLRAGFATSEPIQAVVDRMRRRGVPFHGPLTGEAGSRLRLAFFTDPDGNTLYVMGPCGDAVREATGEAVW